MILLFILILFFLAAIAIGIAYHVTWWRYERLIRACEEKLKNDVTQE